MEVLEIGSTGPNVEHLQSILKELGFYSGNIDGTFGPLTRSSVRTFQRAFGVPANGIVSQQTWIRLTPYVNGYTIYQIHPGDTLSRYCQSI